jgi:hypothetical protein
MQEHHLYCHVSANIWVLSSQPKVSWPSINKGVPKTLQGSEDDNDHHGPKCLVASNPIGQMEDRRSKPAYYEGNHIQGSLDGYHSFSVDLLLHLHNAAFHSPLRLSVTTVHLNRFLLLPNLPPNGRVGGNHNHYVGLYPGLREDFIHQSQGLRRKSIAGRRLGARFASSFPMHVKNPLSFTQGGRGQGCRQQ